jgi:hypothetical protein
MKEFHIQFLELQFNTGYYRESPAIIVFSIGFDKRSGGGAIWDATRKKFMNI